VLEGHRWQYGCSPCFQIKEGINFCEFKGEENFVMLILFTQTSLKTGNCVGNMSALNYCTVHWKKEHTKCLIQIEMGSILQEINVVLQFC
jgi:hypothetical protein